MTAPTSTRCPGVAMAAATRHRIQPAVDAMPRQLVAHMRHAPVRAGLVLDGRFQFNACTVTVVAKTELVTHGTNTLTLFGNAPMIVRKIGGMHIAPIGKFFIIGIMTFQAIL